MTIGTVCPMRRSVFCSPSTSVVGVSPMSQIWSPGAQAGRFGAAAGIDALDDDRRRCSRWKVKSMRSNEERLRWKETNAPRTTPTVRTAISAFVTTDLRMTSGNDDSMRVPREKRR